MKYVIKHHSQFGLQRREPEMTTKEGHLKASRGARLQKIYCDDLAALENFSAVKFQTFTVKDEGRFELDRLLPFKSSAQVESVGADESATLSTEVD